MLAYNDKHNASQLTNCWISQASANQRAGRTGRMRPGTVYRLYSSSLYNKLPQHELSEVQRYVYNIYISIQIHINIISTHIQTYRNISIHIHTKISIYLHTHIHTHTLCVCRYIYMFVCMCIDVFLYVCMCVDVIFMCVGACFGVRGCYV